jgi:hypothetical protein
MGERQHTFGMHVLPENVINVVENNVVIKHWAALFGIGGSKTQSIPQRPHHASLV